MDKAPLHVIAMSLILGADLFDVDKAKTLLVPVILGCRVDLKTLVEREWSLPPVLPASEKLRVHHSAPSEVPVNVLTQWTKELSTVRSMTDLFQFLKHKISSAEDIWTLSAVLASIMSVAGDVMNHEDAKTVQRFLLCWLRSELGAFGLTELTTELTNHLSDRLCGDVTIH